jgi:hypothetical protein
VRLCDLWGRHGSALGLIGKLEGRQRFNQAVDARVWGSASAVVGPNTGGQQRFVGHHLPQSRGGEQSPDQDVCWNTGL